MLTRSNKVIMVERITRWRLISEIDTLIVWTEPNGTDMALSFQEAEGCLVIWWVSDDVDHCLDMLIRLTGSSSTMYRNSCKR